MNELDFISDDELAIMRESILNDMPEEILEIQIEELKFKDENAEY